MKSPHLPPMFRYFFTVLLLVVSVGLPIALSTVEQNPKQIAETDATVELTEDEDETTETREPVLTDIEGHWAQEEIENMYNSHVINGYEDGSFGPDNSVTRTQYLTITLRAFSHDDAEGEFADYAYSIGIISNLDLWKNHGDEHVTRAEALKILIGLANMEVGDTLTPNFPDVDIVNDWFANYSAFALAQGISTGDSEGNFNGNDEVTRAETCVLTTRIMEKLPSSEIED